MTRVVGWVLLMLFTGLATAWLHGMVDRLSSTAAAPYPAGSSSP